MTFTIPFLLQLSLEASSSLLVSNLPFKEGKIMYEISGNQQGFAVAYIKDYGNKIALYKEYKSKILTKNSLTKTLKIIDKNSITTIDLNSKTAQLSTTLRSSLLEVFSILSSDEQKRLLSTKNEKILDFECQDIEIDGKSECINGSLPLYSGIDIFGYKSQMIAVDYSKESVDESYFIPPFDLVDIQKEDEDLENAQKIIKSMLE